jgi:hypothetical protein
MTPAQLDALRTKVFASTDPGMVALVTARDQLGLTAYLNDASGEQGWRSDAPVNGILDAITWASYTPSDAVAGGDTDPLLSVKIGRLLTVQTKQINLQLMLQGRDTLNCSRPNVRGGLRDAVIQVPTGASGALTSPGGGSGVTVLTQCVRPITRAEALLASNAQASDTTGTITARVLTFEGEVGVGEVGSLLFFDDGTPRNP